MIDLISEIHERIGRLTVTIIALTLLAFGRGDPTAIAVIVGIYVGGASAAKVSENVTLTRRRR